MAEPVADSFQHTVELLCVFWTKHGGASANRRIRRARNRNGDPSRGAQLLRIKTCGATAPRTQGERLAEQISNVADLFLEGIVVSHCERIAGRQGRRMRYLTDIMKTLPLAPSPCS